MNHINIPQYTLEIIVIALWVLNKYKFSNIRQTSCFIIMAVIYVRLLLNSQKTRYNLLRVLFRICRLGRGGSYVKHCLGSLGACPSRFSNAI